MLAKLRSDIACILERDPAARSTWEVLTCYPGLHAIWVHKLAHWFWRRNLRWFGRFTSHIGRGFSDACCIRYPCGLSALNGVTPASISYNTMPNE